MESGGTIKTAQATLQLNVCDNIVYQEARKRNVRLGDYRYFLHSYGVFTVTQPRGYYRKDERTYIPATCNECRATSLT